MAETSPWVVSGDPKEIQKAFNSLPVDKQLEIVLGARGKERLRYLFFSENPKELVQRLPELEIFLTVKEVGRSDVILPWIENTSSPLGKRRSALFFSLSWRSSTVMTIIRIDD